MEAVVTSGKYIDVESCSQIVRHHQQTNTELFTGLMPFLSLNKRFQSIEWRKCHVTCSPQTHMRSSIRVLATKGSRFTLWTGMPILASHQPSDAIPQTQRRVDFKLATFMYKMLAALPDATVLVGRLSAHLRRKSPTTVVRHVYICRATDKNSSGWQNICCFRTTDMEQSAGKYAPSWQLCSL